MYLDTDDLVTSSLIAFLIAIVVFVFSIKAFRWLSSENDVADKGLSSHVWVEKPTYILSDPNACTVCETLTHGSKVRYCDNCEIFVDIGCVKKANKRICCKILSTNRPSKTFIHHWNKSLSIDVTCCVCSSDDDTDSILGHFFQCLWCRRFLHANCITQFNQKCDFGIYRKYIIPPFCIKTNSQLKNISKQTIEKVIHPGWDTWTPLIILANKKSGNNDGALIISRFRRLLNPIQVYDVIDCPPEKALNWLKTAQLECVYILVAGGDGTVAGVLNSIHNLQLKMDPAVGIIPLGTGNDLSRVLGWGTSYSDSDCSGIMNAFDNISVVKLDRWKVNILSNVLKKIKITNTITMYNYLGIGLDAQITLDFHRTRKSPLYLFNSTLLNKIIYVGCGTQQFLEHQCKGLPDMIELYMDDKKIVLPDIESIVIVNIESWGAGVNLWKLGANDGNEFGAQFMDDGLLEVLGIRSSVHIAQLKMGIAEPIRIGQASVIRVKLLQKLPVQVDGEPWLQPKCELVLKRSNQATVLKLSNVI
ncbi:PREDICTED: diacylglycerol kinase epsilon [Diuraphis noxia]|uniref:diacylglycerol kinase epsilon n=1 Tax=Diuraphis noxia TaxID=143948 RepID=UPI0007637A8E|nr:PREDICTED: diacylglycerol kinase epsilon [Diuraphis noxia]XP_015369349.1 PREDICTED: diacylglycerol kinase epsilon [Diuraphis noxia]